MYYVYSLSARSDNVRDRMLRDYIGDPNYTFENANRASKACGPLVQWAIAQVSRLSQCTLPDLYINYVYNCHINSIYICMYMYICIYMCVYTNVAPLSVSCIAHYLGACPEL